MKKWSSVTLLASICLILVLVAIPFMAACAKPAPAPIVPPTAPAAEPAPAPPKAITLTLVSFLPLTHPACKPVSWFIDRVNERAKGELVIKFAGGPEAIAAFDQPQAVRTGAVDIAFTVSAYYESLVPEGYCLGICRNLPWEQRENGFTALLDKIHREKMNAVFLGRPNSGMGYVIYSKREIRSPKDITGLVVGCTPTYSAVVERFGGVPVIVGTADLYSALERGMVDSCIITIQTGASSSLNEVTRYMVNHEFLEGNTALLVNLDKWNTLPPHLQKLTNDAAIEMEHYGWEVGQQIKAESLAKLQKGMQIVEFSPEDVKFYLDTIYETMWAKMEKLSPGLTPTFKELLIP